MLDSKTVCDGNNGVVLAGVDKAIHENLTKRRGRQQMHLTKKHQPMAYWIKRNLSLLELKKEKVKQ